MTTTGTWLSSSVRTLRNFVVIGGIGFFIDALMLTAIIQLAQWPPWRARIPSFAAAIAVTWLLNRRHTFAGRGLQSRSVDAMLYGCIQTGGALLNFATFSTCLWYFPQLGRMPVVPLAIGAAVGLFFNFTLSSGLLYARQRAGH